MQFKLTELYNTRYFYITYRTDLNYLFETCLSLKENRDFQYNVGNESLGKVYDCVKSGAPVQFDLAGAKITSDITAVLRAYAERGIVFIDTTAPWRDNILRTNRERSAIDTSNVVPLPEYNPAEMIRDYINSLDKEKVYTLPINNAQVYVPLAVMILISRPSVKICLQAHCKDLFNFVGSKLTIEDLNRYNEFYLTTPEGTQIVSFESGRVYVQRVGMADRVKALTVGSLVPTCFGRDKLIKDETWRSIFQECLNTMNRYRYTRKKTLMEILS